MPREKARIPKALLVRGKKFEKEIKRGDRRTSVRRGHLDYEVGDQVLIGDPKDNWCVYKTITDVKYTTLEEVTPEEWGIEGFQATKETLKNLRKFFSGIKLDSEMTVVTWSRGDIQIW